jgi:hypothetical protein
VGRGAVLKSIEAILGRHQPLAGALGHVAGASSVQDGARIIGDNVHLLDLPLPCVVLGFDGGRLGGQGRDLNQWQATADVYATDVFEAADLVDLIEGACLTYRYDSTLPQPLQQLQALADQRIEAESQSRVITVRITLQAKWA